METKPFMRWEDIAGVCHCGRSKALLIIHRIGPVYIGRTPFVRTEDFAAYIAEHGGVALEWPPRRRKVRS